VTVGQIARRFQAQIARRFQAQFACPHSTRTGTQIAFPPSRAAIYLLTSIIFGRLRPIGPM